MSEYIYRYIDLATLLNMVQTKTLTFVLPSVWEDTFENKFLDELIKTFDYPNDSIAQMFSNLCYAQCWTCLSESDAMWRIYSYGKQSLRIKIYANDIQRLENVYINPVKYCDNVIDYKMLYPNMSIPQLMLNAISQKRVAFKHEEEIRLIYMDKKTDKELESAIATILILIELKNSVKTNSDNETDDENSVELDRETLLRDLINFNVCRDTKIHSVPFDHIENFIKGVMVNPHAPDWYVNTINRYCEINNIPFEGKSDLYQNINEVIDDE